MYAPIDENTWENYIFACHRFCHQGDNPAGDCSPSYVIEDQSLTLCGQYRSVWITIASNFIQFGIAFGGPGSEKQLTNFSSWVGNKFESIDRLGLTKLSKVRFFRSHSKWNHSYYIFIDYFSYFLWIQFYNWSELNRWSTWNDNLNCRDLNLNCKAWYRNEPFNVTHFLSSKICHLLQVYSAKALKQFGWIPDSFTCVLNEVTVLHIPLTSASLWLQARLCLWIIWFWWDIAFFGHCRCLEIMNTCEDWLSWSLIQPTM